MATIGKVSAIFTASTSGLVSGVNQASNSMKKLESSAGSLQRGMSALVAINAAQLFGSIASTVGNYTQSLVAAGQAQAEVIDATSKMAARLGFAYGEFAGLALAGDLAGVSMETVGKAATKADIAFVKATQGSKVAEKAFATLGLSLSELGSQSAAERFQTITRAIADLPTEAEKAAAATALFGKAGAELLPLFSGGSEGIAEAARQAERLGLALTSAQGRDVEAMNDSFTMVSKAIGGIVQQVTAQLAPAITAIANTFVEFIGEAGGANIGKAIGTAILDAAVYFAGVADYFITNSSSTFQYFATVGQFFAAVMDGAGRIAAGFFGAFKLFEVVGNTVGLLISGIIAGLLRAVAKAADLVPGFGNVAETLHGYADTMAAKTEQYVEAGKANMEAAGAGLVTAFRSEAANAGTAMAGPVTTALSEALARANESRAAIDSAGKGAAAASQTSSAVSSAAEGSGPAAIETKSSAGVAEMVKPAIAAAASVAERQLAVLMEIRDALSGREQLLSAEF